MSTTRLIAIGDIHGQISPLRTLIDQIELLNLTSEDILIFLGDYIDRGEDSRAVIELLLEIKARRPNSVFLRGNHEQLLISAMDAEKPEITEFDTLLNGPEMNLWLQNGGIDTLYNYELNNVLEIWSHFPKTHEEFIRATTFEFRKNGYYFVHAGILSFGQWWEGASYNIDPRLWIREPFLSSDEDFGDIVVFGHTPQTSGTPLIMENKIGIDTGSVFGAFLTAVVFEDGENTRFIQVATNNIVRRMELSENRLKMID